MTTLPPEYALRQAATKLGFHVVAVPKGEALASLTIYTTPNENRAILAWAQGTGIVRRMGLSWVACSLAEANEVMARSRDESVGATCGSGEYSAPWVRQGGDGQSEAAPESDTLDDPRMDGRVYLSAADVTREMLDAWPVWEISDLRGVVIATCVLGVWDIPARHWEGDALPTLWRPLRLSGMNARGEIAARDMTPEHFERVRDWQFSDRCNPSDAPEWVRMIRPPAMYHVDASCGGEFWRPTIFAKLDKAQPESKTK